MEVVRADILLLRIVSYGPLNYVETYNYKNTHVKLKFTWQFQIMNLTDAIDITGYLFILS